MFSLRCDECSSAWVSFAHQMQREKHPTPILTCGSETSVVYMPFVCLFCPSPFFGDILASAAINHSVLSLQKSKSLWEKVKEVFPGSEKIRLLEKQDC